MRAIVIGIVALLAGGCAAGRSLDLVSRDPESPWQVGRRWVRTESSVATVNTSYDRTWLDHLIFEVEVVNQSHATLSVDPEQFAYTLSSSRDDLPDKLKRSFPAAAPATVLARLDKEVARQSGSIVAVDILASAVLVAALAMNLVEFGNESQPSDPLVQEWTSSAPQANEPHEPERVNLQRLRDRCDRGLLHATELEPGQSVRGELWLPAKPLWQAIGSIRFEDGMSITAAPANAIPDHELTLRVPPAIGGQEFDYSVVAYY